MQQAAENGLSYSIIAEAIASLRRPPQENSLEGRLRHGAVRYNGGHKYLFKLLCPPEYSKGHLLKSKCPLLYNADAGTALFPDTVPNTAPKEILQSPLSPEFFQNVVSDLYPAPAFDLEQAWYGDNKSRNAEEGKEEYAADTTSPSVSDTQRELLTVPEMEEAFMECQYAALVGALGDVSPDRKRKLSWSILMEPVMFSLIASQYTITRDVDYGPPV